MEPKVYIAGTGMTRFQRRGGSLLEMSIEATEKALADSDIGPEDVDHIIVGVQDASALTGESNIGSKVADAYAQHFHVPIPTSFEVGAASATGAAVLHDAYYRLIASQALHEGPQNILLIGAEKMSLLKRDALTEVIARVIDDQNRFKLNGEGNFEGETMLSVAGRDVTPLYGEQHGLKYEDLDEMSAQLHLRAALNPNARWYGQLSTPEEVWAKINDRDSPRGNPIVVPGTDYRLMHVTSTDDGAAAAILTTKETDIRIAGVGQGNAPMRLENRAEGHYGFEATYQAAIKAFEMAGLTKKGLQGNSILEVHDAFLTYVFPQMAALGLYDTLEESIEAFRVGEFNEDGPLPVNMSGGLKGRGHPLAASSLAQVVEIAKQMRGQAGELQLERPFQYGVSAAIGGFATTNYVSIVKKMNHN